MKSTSSINSESTESPHNECAGMRYRLGDAYQLRDALRKEYIRRSEQGKPFPQREQYLLDSIERVIAAQERAQALRTGKLRSVDHAQITS